MASKQFHLIFAYGSLKRDERNYRFLSTDLKPGEHAKFVAECRLREKYPLVVPRSPCLLNKPGKGKVLFLCRIISLKLSIWVIISGFKRNNLDLLF